MPDNSLHMLAWNTEKDPRPATNLLRSGSAITGPAGCELRIEQQADGRLDLIVGGAFDKGGTLRFPFDPKVSATTVLPARLDREARFHLPVIVHAPGFGSMLVTVA